MFLKTHLSWILKIQYVCTSYVTNLERVRAPLKEHTFDKAFKPKHSQ